MESTPYSIPTNALDAPTVNESSGIGLTDSGYEPRRRVHYRQKQLRKNRYYHGRADCWSPEEAEHALRELIHYFFGEVNVELPAPPIGLPGIRVGDDFDEEAMELLDKGVAYLLALATGEPRRQHNILKDVRERLEAVKDSGREAAHAAHEAAFAEHSVIRWDELEKHELGRTVYFVGAKDGPIKIGVANNAVNRLKSLQAASPATLSILAQTVGGQPREREYHRQFAAHRLHGEWFERHPDILAEIDRLSTPPSHGLGMGG